MLQSYRANATELQSKPPLQLFHAKDLLFEQVFHLIEQMRLQSTGGFCRARVLYGRLANEGQVFHYSFEQSGLLLIPTGGVRKVTYLQQFLAFIEEGE